MLEAANIAAFSVGDEILAQAGLEVLYGCVDAI